MRRNIKIMGIINLNDDSYFSASRCPSVEMALKRAEKIAAEGADIFDIGSCSTRPGSVTPDEDEEWRRLEGAIKAIRREFPSMPISIDTFRAGIARKCFDAIGHITVNDITASEGDSLMLETVASLGLQYIAMHMRGNPQTMTSLCSYGDITEDIIGYFRRFALKASSFGITDYVIDPGFGFAKTLDQNYTLLHNLDAFACLGKEILVGVSRKSMIYKYFGITPEDSLAATQVLHMEALIRGAGILRVHDVAEAKQCAQIYQKLYMS